MSGKFIEKLLIRLIFSAVIFLLFFQIITSFKESIGEENHLVNGNSTKDWTYESEVITFFLKDYSLMPHLKVIVNGEVKGTFKNRYVTVAVHGGDVLSLDGTFYEIPVRIEVLNISGGIKHPKKGSVLKLHGNILPVGMVKEIEPNK